MVDQEGETVGKYVTHPQDPTRYLTDETGIECCCPPPPECFINLVPCCNTTETNLYITCATLALLEGNPQCAVFCYLADPKTGMRKAFTACLADSVEELPPGAILVGSGIGGVDDSCEDCCDPQCFIKANTCGIDDCTAEIGSFCSNVIAPPNHWVACNTVPGYPDNLFFCGKAFRAAGNCWELDNCITVISGDIPDGDILLVPEMWFDTCELCCCQPHCNEEHFEVCEACDQDNLQISLVGMITTPDPANSCVSDSEYDFPNPSSAGITLVRNPGSCSWSGGENCSLQPCDNTNWACIQQAGLTCEQFPEPHWRCEMLVRVRKIEITPPSGNCETCCSRNFIFTNFNNIGGCPPPTGWILFQPGPPTSLCAGSPTLIVG